MSVRRALTMGALSLSLSFPPAGCAQAEVPRVDPGWSRAHATPAQAVAPAPTRHACNGRLDDTTRAGAGGTARRPVAPERPSAFAAAVNAAWKKGVIEDGVDGYTEVLIACQQERSMLLTTPFMRSDSQQAHCFRY